MNHSIPVCNSDLWRGDLCQFDGASNATIQSKDGHVTDGVGVAARIGEVAGTIRDVIVESRATELATEGVATTLHGFQLLGFVDLPVSLYGIGSATLELVVAESDEEHVEASLSLVEAVGDLLDSGVNSALVVSELMGDASDYAWVPPLMIVSSVLKGASMVSNGYGWYQSDRFIRSLDAVADADSDVVDQLRALMTYLGNQNPEELERHFGVADGMILRDVARNCEALLEGEGLEDVEAADLVEVQKTVNSLIALARTHEGRTAVEGIVDGHSHEGRRVERTLEWIATRELKVLEKQFGARDGMEVRAVAAEALAKLAIAEQGTSSHYHAVENGQRLISTLKGRTKAKISSHKLRLVVGLVGLVALALFFLAAPLSYPLFVLVALFSLGIAIKDYREKRKPIIDPNRPRSFLAPKDPYSIEESIRRWRQQERIASTRTESLS